MVGTASGINFPTVLHFRQVWLIIRSDSEYYVIYEVSVNYDGFGVVGEFSALLAILAFLAFQTIENLQFLTGLLANIIPGSVCRGSGPQMLNRG